MFGQAFNRLRVRMMGGRWTITTSTVEDEFLVPSPGGWQPPEGARPGWDWVPPYGAHVNTEALPTWVNLWRRLPLIDRYAAQCMWHRGGWLVKPAGRASGGGDLSGDRSPLHPVQPGDRTAATLSDAAE